MQLQHGITKFKCATIAEAEITSGAGASDVLLAYPPVGPNVDRFLDLIAKHPSVRFSCVADNLETLLNLSDAAARASVKAEVLIDLDVGMHRTGIEPGRRAFELYRLLASLPALEPGGLHAYDGHLHQSDLAERSAQSDAAFAPVDQLRRRLIEAGLRVPKLILGGTPTFPVHANRPDVECSPGTCVFWDEGYAAKCPDLDFLPAALVLTRVISKPAGNRLTLDLGHKAIAAENPHPRVIFLNLPEAKAVMHSEEHLVIETPRAAEFAVGDAFYGVPWHVCPTVNLHGYANVVREGRAVEQWRVSGRERILTV